MNDAAPDGWDEVSLKGTNNSQLTVTEEHTQKKLTEIVIQKRDRRRDREFVLPLFSFGFLEGGIFGVAVKRARNCNILDLLQPKAMANYYVYWKAFLPPINLNSRD